MLRSLLHSDVLLLALVGLALCLGFWAFFVFAYVRDARERKLRASEERNRMLLASLPQRVFFKRCPDLRFESVNQAFANDLGLATEQVVGKTDYDFYPKEVADKYRADDRAVIESGEPAFLVETNHGGETERVVEVTKAPVRDDEGRTVGLLGIYTDVTDRHHAEQALRESEERFRLLVDSALDGISICEYDPATGKRRLTFCNDRFVEMSGFGRAELEAAEDLNELTRSEQSDEEEADIRRRITSGEPYGGTSSWLRPDGRENVHEFVAVAMKAGDNHRLLAFDHDIAKRKRTEARLQRRLELEAVTAQVSSRFVNLSHDQVDAGIGEALATIGRFAGADRAYVFQFREDGRSADNTHEWCAEGVEPEMAGRRGIRMQEHLPWLTRQLRTRDSVDVSDVSGLAEEAARDGERLLGRGVHALALFPMKSGAVLTGFVGIEFLRPNEQFDEDTVALLRMLGPVLANALERRQTEEALLASEERYRLIFEKATDMIAFHDLSTFAHIYVNPATLATLDCSEADLLRTTAGELVHPEDRGDAFAKFRKAVAAGRGTAEFRVRKSDGTYIWVEATGRITPDEKGHPVALVISRDVTERIMRREKLRALTLEDPLTGVNNRRGFFHLADQQLKFANRTGSTLLLFFADVDDMKWINDHQGHKQGDLALIEAANVLREAFRDSDIIGRVGGDEFAVLALQAAGATAEDILARLEEGLTARNEQAGRQYQLTLSVGIAVYRPSAPVSLDELMAQADARMYEQKWARRSSLSSDRPPAHLPAAGTSFTPGPT